jgi:coenzyme F420-reducing hydrogenase delta subunit
MNWTRKISFRPWLAYLATHLDVAHCLNYQAKAIGRHIYCYIYFPSLGGSLLIGFFLGTSFDLFTVQIMPSDDQGYSHRQTAVSLANGGSRESLDQHVSTSLRTDIVCDTPAVTLFICSNSYRSGRVPTSGTRPPPDALPVEWPFAVHEVRVPCAGKLQPEHLLKAFEAGADLVCVVACDETNCHYLEGSRRAKRRVEYVQGLLKELGLGGERVLLTHLPGSSREDMALGCSCGAEGAAATDGRIAERLKALSDEIAGQLKRVGVSPLRRSARPS